MPQPRKRNTAYKIRIGDILRGNPVYEQTENLNERLQHVELGDKKLVRVNIVANVIDKFENDGEEKRFASLTIDDGSGQIKLRLFGEDINRFKEINQGDTLVVIGRLRSFRQELYIIPELMKKQDPKYLLVRKLETESSQPPTQEKKKEIKALKDEVVELIKGSEQQEGIDKDQIVMKIDANPDLISKEIQKLLEDGIIYEPKPGRVRYLG